ncbi:MAG: thymidine phosphorylase family protein [Nevskiaceae bacterium]|nr:MAG: thymidine phosphorylase family protein [Nevskiaceae bacterium]TAM24101.1 MAG: thymidine phosphorylase family protein [Nevskiaceae bacterium]
MSDSALPTLRIHQMGINTYQEPVAYLRSDCHVCRAQGFDSHSRVRISLDGHSVIATLNIVAPHLLEADHVGLSDAAWRVLGGRDDDRAQLSHPEPLESFSQVRGKVYGHSYSHSGLQSVIADITAGRYSDLEMAAFVTACAGDALSLDETIALTEAMIDAGQRLHWSAPLVVDKHCVGGLPGNRTTPIIVAIAAAAGMTIPKTSSRAITSPSGTADTMSMLAPVELDLPAMRRVVEREGGCVVWGGAMGLSPADDLLIRVERPLDFDSEGQLAASVISKKVAAGSSHLLIDMPIGPTAKVRSPRAAESLTRRLHAVGEALGLSVRVLRTDGSQPVGRGIGPALEAWDLLAVLQNQADAPADLRERSLLLAGQLLEIGGRAALGEGAALARELLSNGAAWRKFQAICQAQGGLREPPRATHHQDFLAGREGRVQSIDNRRLARIAKLAGAPASPAAGIALAVHCGDRVERGQRLYRLHAQTPGELSYAAAYACGHPETIVIEED